MDSCRYEVSKRNLGFDPPKVDKIIVWESGTALLAVRARARVVGRQVKLQRAHGGCLGIERRRRT